MRRSRLLDTEQWTVNHEAVVGLVSLVLLGILSTVGLKAAFGAYDAGYDLTARFEGAGQNLDNQSVVKLRGVDVGTVESINLGDDDRAVVRMHIDPDVDVPDTTLAVIRPISIFGPKFIDLVPGQGEGEGPFLGDGDEIERTRSSLELGDILGEASELLGAVEPGDVTTILHTLAEGVDGLDQEISDSITNGQTVLNAMVASSEDRHALFSDMALVAEELADRGDTIVNIGENAHEVLPTITEHEDDFAGLLEATSRLSSDLAGVVDANRDVLGPGIEGGAHLSDITADHLQDLVTYLQFVKAYGGIYSQVIRVPVAGEEYIAATQQFLMSSDPCEILFDVPDCEAPAIDPGPQAAG